MSHEDFPELLNKYLKGECTVEEKSLLDEWYDSFEKEPGVLKGRPEREVAGIKIRIMEKIRAILGITRSAND